MTGRRGFSLLEVAVAMAILGIALTVLFGQISGSLAGIPRIERSNALVEHARTKLAELALVAEIHPSDHAEGRTADGVQWRVATTMFIPPAPSNAAYIVKASVSVERDGRSLEFHTYRQQRAAPASIPPLGARLAEVDLP